jgi:serine/threonine-protein phosphatase 5
LNLALIYIKQKEFKLAMEISDEALKIDPDSVKAYYRRGQAHNGLDLRGEAIKDFEVVLEKQPSNKEAKIA